MGQVSGYQHQQTSVSSATVPSHSAQRFSAPSAAEYPLESVSRSLHQSPQVASLVRLGHSLNAHHALSSSQTVQRVSFWSKLATLAKSIFGASEEIQEEIQDLSERNQEILEALLQQLQAIEQIENMLDEYERQQNALLPPVINIDEFIEFQPDFIQPPMPVADILNDLGILEKFESFKQQKCSPLAAQNLIDRLGTGLKPASQLHGAALGADQSKANVVCVNVFPQSGGDAEKEARMAHFAQHNQAGGAGAIAIEQFGDTGKIDERVLSQRANDSAVMIIDPQFLPQDEIDQLNPNKDGGEFGLRGVPANSIVAVLVPANMAHLFSEEQIARHHIHFVGSVQGPVYYAGTHDTVNIAHPDFQSALQNIFATNPNKKLLTHTTRLGAPMAIK